MTGHLSAAAPPLGLADHVGPDDHVADWSRRLASASAEWGRRVDVDRAALLDARVRSRGLTPRGQISHGGSTRLLRCADGWAAVSLVRETDRDLLAAWRGLLALDPWVGEDWQNVTALVAASRGTDLVETATLLGLAVGVLAERRADDSGGVATTNFRGTPTRRRGAIRVVDLSALWAGPLCAALLGEVGAEVVKVESIDRPDGARRGDPVLHRQLNAAKRPLHLDLASPEGRRELASVVADADVIVTASRLRALRHLGLDPYEWMDRPNGPQVWVSITGHGLASDRVAFGDDAAVAGGLVGCDDAGPVFAGDALADPLSGLAAATHAAEAVAAGARVLLDVTMAGVAAAVAGRT